MMMEMVLGEMTMAQTPVKDVPSKLKTSTDVVTKPLFEEKNVEKPLPPPVAQVLPPPPPQLRLEVPSTMEEELTPAAKVTSEPEELSAAANITIEPANRQLSGHCCGKSP